METAGSAEIAASTADKLGRSKTAAGIMFATMPCDDIGPGQVDLDPDILISTLRANVDLRRGGIYQVH